MNIHFAFRPQTGGVTEIPIRVTAITFWMRTLDKHEPFGLRVSTCVKSLDVLWSRIWLVHYNYYDYISYSLVRRWLTFLSPVTCEAMWPHLTCNLDNQEPFRQTLFCWTLFGSLDTRRPLVETSSHWNETQMKMWLKLKCVMMTVSTHDISLTNRKALVWGFWAWPPRAPPTLTGPHRCQWVNYTHAPLHAHTTPTGSGWSWNRLTGYFMVASTCTFSIHMFLQERTKTIAEGAKFFLFFVLERWRDCWCKSRDWERAWYCAVTVHVLLQVVLKKTPQGEQRACLKDGYTWIIHSIR